VSGFEGHKNPTHCHHLQYLQLHWLSCISLCFHMFD
jgi:hypothetical protein